MVLLFATFNVNRYGGILTEYTNGMKQVTNMWRTGNILEDTCLVVSCCWKNNDFIKALHCFSIAYCWFSINHTLLTKIILSLILLLSYDANFHHSATKRKLPSFAQTLNFLCFCYCSSIFRSISFSLQGFQTSICKSIYQPQSLKCFKSHFNNIEIFISFEFPKPWLYSQHYNVLVKIKRNHKTLLKQIQSSARNKHSWNVGIKETQNKH